MRASCNPCTVEVGKTSTVSAVANSSIGCTVTYAWSAPAGTFTNSSGQSTPWTAPNQEGPVPVTVTVTCPQDGKTARDTVNIQVVRPAVVAVTFGAGFEQLGAVLQVRLEVDRRAEFLDRRLGAALQRGRIDFDFGRGLRQSRRGNSCRQRQNPGET